MSSKKQTPLTVEAFFEEVMPAIEEMMDKKIDGAKTVLQGEIEGVKTELQGVKSDVLDYKVETIGEIKALGEQVTTTLHQYERTDKRLTRVERRLKLAPLDF